ncbi:thermonuclease [Clostridium botulinum]|uniref:thermonuclease family protein n=1 Tax=Clostridium botulinum TaxID=1491 RepID=UPI00016BB306|nr:thermonuclease family protein [Clostridium botulinum]EDT84136.1 thermonuclease [Clostridium botulinum Bf]NEZ86258.1 thermonuclease [Clostridium botulinum]NFE31607.1 thermonuclease [Clostridium botulinum]RFM19720.1 thermonuclease [Clostridium botulinum]WCJ75357.1 thermonuclease family protein [Clostridium botulinum]
MGIKKFIPIILITVLLTGCQNINEATKLSQDVVRDNVSIINNIKGNNYPGKNNLSLKKATVYRVIDGDTIILNTGERVRFIGVNCPEDTTKHEDFGREATLYTRSMLEDKTVYLEKDISNTDKYGRLLRYVWLEIPESNSDQEINSKMFNSMLLSNGFGQQSTFPPNVKYVDTFTNCEREDRSAKKGLWKINSNGTTNGDIRYKKY